MAEGRDLHQVTPMHGHPSLDALTVGPIRGAQFGVGGTRHGADRVVESGVLVEVGRVGRVKLGKASRMNLGGL